MNFIGFVIAFFATLVGCTFSCRRLRASSRLFGFYTIVDEGSCKVYVLFGKVVAVLERTRPAFSARQTRLARVYR